MAKANTQVLSPNYGLYLDRPRLDIAPEALADGMNFRIINKKINNFNLGRRKFANWTLDGKVTGVDNFFPRGLDEHLMFLTPKDIFRYNATVDKPVILTPRYETGTVAVTNGSPVITGTGTAWSTNAKEGDLILIGATGKTFLDDTGLSGTGWVEVLSVDSDTQITLTTSPAWATSSGQAYTLRQTFTESDFASWDFDTFVNDGDSGDDLWFATNGVDDVVTWNGEADQVTVHPELGFTCETLATYSNMMIYGAITETSDGSYFPTSMINSEPGFPLHAGDNVTDPLSIAGQFQVHSGTDAISNLIPLGDNLVIYCEAHIVLAQFVGGDTVFIFRAAISDLGPISRDAIADFGDYHEFIGSDTQYTFDGVSVDETNSQVMRAVLLSMDPLRMDEAFGHFDESNGDLLWAIPLTTDAGVGTVGTPVETAYVEHYLEDIPNGIDTPFSKRSFKFTATGFYERSEGALWQDAALTWSNVNFAWNDQFNQLAAPLNIGGDENGQLWIFAQDQQDDGAGLPSFVRFGRRATGSGRERNLIRRVYPFASNISSHTLKVNIYVSDHAAGDATLATSLDFDETLVEGGHFVSPFKRGRYFEVEFASPTGTSWELSGYDVDVTNGGKR
jgi:hypothetical protein